VPAVFGPYLGTLSQDGALGNLGRSDKLHTEEGQTDDYREDGEELKEVVEVLHIVMRRIPYTAKPPHVCGGFAFLGFPRLQACF